MKDEKTKLKQEQLIEMVNSFCDTCLNDEYKALSVKLINKMGRKHNIPFKRGKLKNWASGVVYAIAQINFLFDKSQDIHTSPDEICDFFGTKKSTASNKARDIRDMFKIGHFDDEFSAKHILDNVPKVYVDPKSGLLIPEEMINSNPMDTFFDEVYYLFEEGKVDKAIEMLDSITEDSPEYARALFYKSMMISSQSDENKGFELFQDALTTEFKNNHGEFIGGDDFEELFTKGKLSFEIEEFQDALHYFNQAIQLKSDSAEALYYESLCLAHLDEFDDALDLINDAIKLNPKNDKFWNDKANFLVKLGYMDEAYECFDRAIELNPKDSVIWSNKAFTYLENDEDENALNCYDKAIELNPNDVHPIVGKAGVYMTMADFENAKKYFDLAKEIDENDLELLTNYGHFMLIQQNFDEAIKSWDKCLEIDKEDSMIWIFKALAYIGLEDDEMSNKCIDTAFKIDPMVILAFEDLLEDN